MMSTHNSSAPRHREWKLGCKVYIGNLAEGASKSDIEDAFNKYGPLRNVWVARNPPGFAFVEFEDGRDAEDACRHLDGTRIAGGRIKAEMSHGRTRRGRGGGPPTFRGHGHNHHHHPPLPPPPYGAGPHPMNGGGPYSGGGIGPIRGGYHGGPPRAGPFYSNGGGGDYHDTYVNYRGGGHHNHHHHHGPPHHHHQAHHPGVPPMHHHQHHHGYGMDSRAPRGAPHDRHIPRARSPIGIKEYRTNYSSRSRSNSLGKSPQPPQSVTQTQMSTNSQQQDQQQRTARPRTPPSQTPSP